MRNMKLSKTKLKLLKLALMVPLNTLKEGVNKGKIADDKILKNKN